MAEAGREGTGAREGWVVWLVANPWTKVMSFFFAVAAWVYVQGDEIHEQRVRAKVQWELPAELVTTTPLPEAVMIEVRGARAATRRAEEALVRLRVDLTGFPIGEHSVVLEEYEPTGLPQAVQVIGVEPGELRFELDHEAERKVIVRPVLAGAPAEGFAVEKATLEPDVVMVRGPRSVVASMEDIGTQPIDVSNMVSPGIREVDLALPPGVELVSNVVPTAEIKVAPAKQVVMLTEVPVYVWQHPEYLPEVQHVDVTLEGPSDQLRRVSEGSAFAFVHVPDPPNRDRYEAEFGPQQGVRVRVWHPGGEDVRVTAMVPNMVAVVRP